MEIIHVFLDRMTGHGVGVAGNDLFKTARFRSRPELARFLEEKNEDNNRTTDRFVMAGFWQDDIPADEIQ